MRLLILGGWGQLGSDIASLALERGHDLVRPTRVQVDVSDAVSVEAAVERAAPDVVVDAAAFHRTADCEVRPERAFLVNAVGALHAARASGRVGARCVYVSTDYVFAGEADAGYVEEDPVAPVNVYGASKAAGERLTALGCPGWMVVRGSALFGHAGSSGKGGNFVESMLAGAAAGRPLAVVDDLVFAPTATHDMAERILLLLERDAPAGIYHAANRGSCSWHGFAEAIFKLAGVDADLSPRRTEPLEVRRPRSSILLDTRSAALGLPPGRHWEDALRWYLDHRPGEVRKAPGGAR